MIFKILDAYEEKISKKESFGEKFKRIDKKTKILSFVILALTIGAIPIAWAHESRQFALIYILINTCIIQILGVVLEKDRRRNYESSMRLYNEKLDRLKELIEEKEFSICSGPKLLVLIENTKEYIEKENQTILGRVESAKQYQYNIILPIITFAVGTMAESLGIQEVVLSAIMVVIILSLGRIAWNQLYKTWKVMFPSSLDKMESLLNELQDLYVRNYVD